MREQLENFVKTYLTTAKILKMYEDYPPSIIEKTVQYASIGMADSAADFQMALANMALAKIFEVPEKVVNALAQTDNVVTPTRLPFPVTWIECKLRLENVWMMNKVVPWVDYHGLLLIETSQAIGKTTTVDQLSHLVQDGKELLEKPYPHIYIYAITSDCEPRNEKDAPKGYAWDTPNYGHIKISYYKEYDEYGKHHAPEWEKERDFLRIFVANFLDFLNEPDVEVHEVLRTNRSVRKAQKHHKEVTPIPTRVVTVTGKLKIYLDNFARNVKGVRHFSHAFAVRGHWRHLTAKRWVHKRYLKVWVTPHVRGEGLFVRKKYKLKPTESDKTAITTTTEGELHEQPTRQS